MLFAVDLALAKQLVYLLSAAPASNCGRHLVAVRAGHELATKQGMYAAESAYTSGYDDVARIVCNLLLLAGRHNSNLERAGVFKI